MSNALHKHKSKTNNGGNSGLSMIITCALVVVMVIAGASCFRHWNHQWNSEAVTLTPEMYSVEYIGEHSRASQTGKYRVGSEHRIQISYEYKGNTYEAHTDVQVDENYKELCDLFKQKKEYEIKNMLGDIQVLPGKTEGMKFHYHN